MFTLIFTVLLAQTVVPHSSTNPVIPASGDKKNLGLDCYDDPTCKVMVNLRTQCYASNLRSVKNPLKESSLLTGEITLGDYDLKVAIPALYTYKVSASSICAISGTEIRCRGDRTYRYTGTGHTDTEPKTSPAVAAAKVPCSSSGSSGPCNCVYDIEQVKSGRDTRGYSRTGSVVCASPLDNDNKSSELGILGTDTRASIDESTVGQNIVVKVTGNATQSPKMPQMEKKADGSFVLKPNESPLVPKVSFKQLSGYSSSGSWSSQEIAEAQVAGRITEESVAYNLESVVATPESGYTQVTIDATFPGAENFCGGYYSPLMLFFDNKRPKFEGVSAFPLYKGVQYVNWPEAGASGYWLVNDKKGKGEITKADQLFGTNDGEFANGFEALREHDSNKDGLITKGDKVWKSLYLWNDKNGDGVSDKDELFTLASFDVESISLTYDATRTAIVSGDRAAFRERSHFITVKSGKVVTGEIVDIYLTPHMLSKKLASK